METTKILYIAQEITPYVAESEIASLCRSLPLAIQDKGKEIRLFMPKFGGINERRNQLHEVIRLSGLNIVIDDTDHPLIIKVASIPAAHMQVYFIDNDDYFVRKGISKDAASGEDFPDNVERLIFFIRGVMETVKKLRWAPDIIHCHGWMTSVVPLYVKTAYKDDTFFKNSKIVTSLYNEGFESPFSDKFGNNVLIDGVAKKDVKQVAGKSITCNELLKFALDYSDAAIQGSPELPAELLAYAQSKVQHFLGYQSSEDRVDAYNAFYDEILKK